jgi:hypothetical protein
VRALFINSITKTIEEVEINGLEDLQRLVGGYIAVGTTLVKDTIENTVFVDDEGLLKDPNNYFYIKGSHQPFAGNGVLIGTNDEGDSIDTNFILNDITNLVQFLSTSDVVDLINQGLI